MSQVAPRIDPGWDWRQHDHPTPSVVIHPDADHDTDRRIVGTILGPTGKPLHTVLRSDALDFGFQRQNP